MYSVSQNSGFLGAISFAKHGVQKTSYILDITFFIFGTALWSYQQCEKICILEYSSRLIVKITSRFLSVKQSWTNYISTWRVTVMAYPDCNSGDNMFFLLCFASPPAYSVSIIPLFACGHLAVQILSVGLHRTSSSLCVSISAGDNLQDGCLS